MSPPPPFPMIYARRFPSSPPIPFLALLRWMWKKKQGRKNVLCCSFKEERRRLGRICDAFEVFWGGGGGA